MFDRLPEDTQTLHAELLALLIALEGERRFAHLDGSFVQKTLGGRGYVYFQYSDPGGRRRQFAVGPASRTVDAIVKAYREGRVEFEADRVPIERLVRVLRSAGLPVFPHMVARVVRALADAALFHHGGVLVGTYAFVLAGNSLGVRWPAGTWTTQDVDIAAHLTVATEDLVADVPRALEQLQMGFVPVPQLDHRHASTSFKVRGQQLRLDLVTPGATNADAPIYLPNLRAAAAPIRFLSLLLDDTMLVPAIGDGAMLVRIPSPARFAMHKLLLSQMRSAPQQAKSQKDLHQAALLLEVLGEDRPDDLEQVARTFHASGDTVTKKVLRALAAAVKRWPEAQGGAAVVRSGLSRV
jgi:hypothetical protein